MIGLPGSFRFSCVSVKPPLHLIIPTHQSISNTHLSFQDVSATIGDSQEPCAFPRA